MGTAQLLTLFRPLVVMGFSGVIRQEPGRMMTPTIDLQRFHTAQGDGSSGVYAQSLRELQAGRKQSHWIWFVLPQLRGLGRSAMAERCGIADLAEARAYLADALLRQRLEEVIAVISTQLQRPGQTLTALMGGELDAARRSAASSSLKPQACRAPGRCWISWASDAPPRSPCCGVECCP